MLSNIDIEKSLNSVRISQTQIVTRRMRTLTFYRSNIPSFGIHRRGMEGVLKGGSVRGTSVRTGGAIVDTTER